MGLFTLHKGERVFGLDFVRFIAIITVVYGHSIILLPDSAKSIGRWFVMDGVAVFFVLSGFLIGQIIFKLIQNEQTAWKDLYTFWKRRWLRTIPAYLVVLILVSSLTYCYMPQRMPQNLFLYFFFCQNIFTEIPAFFQESWSLSIEEWFYLLIPPMLFLGARLIRKKRATLSLLLTLLVVILLIRLVLLNGLEVNKREGLLLSVVPRLDGILFGVILAYLKMHEVKVWNCLSKRAFFFVSLCCFILLLAVLAQFHKSDSEYWFVLWSPLLKSLGISLLLPFLAGWELKKPNFLTKFIQLTSLTSYSIYLLNRTLVIDFIIKLGLHDERGKHLAGAYWLLDFALFWILTYLLSYCLFRLVETPFLNLRDSRK